MKGFVHTLKKSSSTGENLTFLLKAKDAVFYLQVHSTRYNMYNFINKELTLKLMYQN